MRGKLNAELRAIAGEDGYHDLPDGRFKPRDRLTIVFTASMARFKMAYNSVLPVEAQPSDGT